MAGLGALGAAVGIAMLFGLFVWWTMPGPGTGMDRTHAVLSWIGVGGVAAMLILVHILIGRTLVRDADEKERAKRAGRT